MRFARGVDGVQGEGGMGSLRRSPNVLKTSPLRKEEGRETLGPK